MADSPCPRHSLSSVGSRFIATSCGGHFEGDTFEEEKEEEEEEEEEENAEARTLAHISTSLGRAGIRTMEGRFQPSNGEFDVKRAR